MNGCGNVKSGGVVVLRADICKGGGTNEDETSNAGTILEKCIDYNSAELTVSAKAVALTTVVVGETNKRATA